MLKKIFGSALFGVEAFTIAIEVNVDKGIGYHLVGLPDNAIKESNFRIAAALQNNSYKIPGKKLIQHAKKRGDNTDTKGTKRQKQSWKLETNHTPKHTLQAHIGYHCKKD